MNTEAITWLWKRGIGVLLAAGVAHAGPLYTITDLGSLGGSSAAAFGLSSNGMAAGVAVDPFGVAHAMFSGGAAQAFTTLPLADGVSGSEARAVNAAGQVAGTQHHNGASYATVWNADGTASILSEAGSYATGINENGQVTGMRTVSGEGGPHGQAFVTSPDGTVVNLGTFANGSWSSGYGVNTTGQVAGYGMTSAGQFAAFLWSAGSGYVRLGTLGGRNSYAMQLNDYGAAVGHAQLSSGYLHAAVWNGGSIQDLGTLASRGNSYGYGINALGEVVGASNTTSGNMHAFLYQNGEMLDLNGLLSDADWLLTHAYAINDSGQIAGAGFYRGVEHAFRLDLVSGNAPGESTFSLSFNQEPSTVPEPASWATALLALLGCGAAWRRRVRVSV